MRTILKIGYAFALLSVILCGCGHGVETVKSKHFMGRGNLTAFNVPLPVGVCFFITSDDRSFEDSCSRYNVGDTIGKTKISPTIIHDTVIIEVYQDHSQIK